MESICNKCKKEVAYLNTWGASSGWYCDRCFPDDLEKALQLSTELKLNERKK